MNSLHFKLTSILLAAIAILIFVSAFTPLAAKTIRKPFSSQEKAKLISILTQRGFEETFVEKIVHDKRLYKIPILVSRNVHNKENPRNYENFLNSYSLKTARRFSRKWKTVLHKASREFDVDQEVLVAILLIETGFGNILGRYPVISVFSSILIEHDYKAEKFSKRTDLTEEEAYVLRRLTKKAAWANEEMTALLRITQKTKQTPFRFKGSYAGAFGIPQFLPSSYLKWGYDSDKNGFVNLFLFPDAIYSTANYLKGHGWKKGLYLESNKDVIYKYNHSDVYVDAVLKVAKKIKGSQSSKHQESSKQTGLIPESRITKKGSTS
jgi:peptidoglycan lytic transglycosylase B